MCQSTKSLCDSGAVGLVLSAIVRETVGSERGGPVLRLEVSLTAIEYSMSRSGHLRQNDNYLDERIKRVSPRRANEHDTRNGY